MKNNSMVEFVFGAVYASGCMVLFLVFLGGYMRTMFQAPGYFPMSTGEQVAALLVMIALLSGTLYNVLKAVHYFNVWYKKNG